MQPVSVINTYIAVLMYCFTDSSLHKGGAIQKYIACSIYNTYAFNTKWMSEN